MRMIGTIASMRHKIAVVLQHIEMIVGNDALYLVLRPILRLRRTQVDRLPLEWLRLPVRWKIRHHPVMHFRVVHIQCAWLGRQASLRPIDPKSKLQPMLMGILCDDCQPMRKLLRIRIPVADSAKPAGIHVKHLDTKFGRVTDHPASRLLINVHPAAPTVIDNQRVVRILPCLRVTKHGANPTPKEVTRPIWAILKTAEEHARRFESLARLETGTERTGIRI